MRDFFTFSGFETLQNLWLTAGFCLFFLSLFFYYKHKTRWAIGMLTLGGCALFVFAALSDPFLNLWDERFHALVAKNCMEHPFMPMLYKDFPIAEFDPAIWSHAHVWLHKQPLFLWQIALSFRLFGVSEFSLRLPSVVMATLLIPIVYRIGKMLLDDRLGYFAAISVAFSWFLLNLVSGRGDVDHNNVCFVFYVSVSVWTWMEYIRSGRKIGWLVLMAVSSGCAVLTKWLVGLLSYLVWGVYLLVNYRFKIKEWKIRHSVLALAITMAVFLPWQIYTYHTFPQEWKMEQQNNAKHFTLVLENHHHERGYYLKTLPHLYIGDRDYTGDTDASIMLNGRRVFHLLLILGGFALLLYRIKQNNRRIPLIVTVLFVYVFFSLARTKMIAYPFCLAIAGYLSLGILLRETECLLQKFIVNRHIGNAIFFPVVIIAALYQLNFTWYRQHHANLQDDLQKDCIHNREVYLQLREQLPEKSVVFNVRGDKDWNNYCNTVDAMFYSDAVCYAFVPTEEQLKMLQAEGYHVAVLTSHEIPDYMLDDTAVQKVDAEIWGDY